MGRTLPNPDKVDWNAPFRAGENLRVLTPIAKAYVPKAERRHLASLPREYRERIEREWQDAEDAVPSVNQRLTPEQKARADAEWLAQPTMKGE